MTSFQFDAIGTLWQIDIYSSYQKASELKDKILTRIEKFDRAYSRFRKDSWVSKNAYKPGEAAVPDDFNEMFSLYEKLYDISGRLFTPLIGSLLEEAGYDMNYSLIPKKLASPPPLSEAIKIADGKIKFLKPVLFDFGAAGKGYLVDLISQLIERYGVSSYVIDASGDMYIKAPHNKPFVVGLEDPKNHTRVIGTANIANMAICGSAGNRRKWSKFHHTINPVRLTSPDEIIATWVVADTALLADALSTCLYLDPHPEKYKDFSFECVLLYKDNSAFRSTNFPGELFTVVP